MKFFDKLKLETKAIQKQIAEAKTNERGNAETDVEQLCKELGFTTEVLQDSLAAGRQKQ